MSVGEIELNIAQQYVGDVGGVVWDAALVLNAFLERLASKQRYNLSYKFCRDAAYSA